MRLLNILLLGLLCLSQESLASVDELSEQIKKAKISATPVSQTVQPGFFYRHLEANPSRPVQGVYAKDTTYYGLNVSGYTADTQTKDHVFSQDGSNWMGAVFWGVWSYAEGDDTKIEVVSIPVRQTESGNMTYKKKKSRYYRPRCIWKTGHGSITVDNDDGNRFAHIPAKGKHTEEPFIDYMEMEETQKALWQYFLHESKKRVKSAERTLDCVGFNIYSTLDACDRCLRRLLTFKTGGLPHLVPDDVSTLGVLPMIITYESKTPYKLGLSSHAGRFSDNTVYSASMIFLPPPRLMRLGAYDVEEETHDSARKGGDEEIIRHQAVVDFEEKEEPSFIILKMDGGKDVPVRVH